MPVLSDVTRLGKGWVLAASGGTLLAIGLVTVLLFSRCGSDTPPPKIDPQTQKLVDSLKETNVVFQKQADSLKLVVHHDTIFAKATNVSAERSRANAAVAGHTADSLATLAAAAKTAQDSAAKYHAALDARTRERDTLLVTIVKKDSVIQARTDAITGVRLLWAADTARRVKLQEANDRLVKDIAKLHQPCYVPGTFRKVPCPSRTVVGVLSAVTGYLAGRKGP